MTVTKYPVKSYRTYKGEYQGCDCPRCHHQGGLMLGRLHTPETAESGEVFELYCVNSCGYLEHARRWDGVEPPMGVMVIGGSKEMKAAEGLLRTLNVEPGVDQYSCDACGKMFDYKLNDSASSSGLCNDCYDAAKPLIDTPHPEPHELMVPVAELIETPNGVERIDCTPVGERKLVGCAEVRTTIIDSQGGYAVPEEFQDGLLKMLSGDVCVSRTVTVDLSMGRIMAALRGMCGADQRDIAQVCTDATLLMLKKNADYGSSVFKTPKLAPNAEPGDAILVRLSDKIERFETLQKKSAEVAESLEDTALDAAAYFLLWLVYRKRQKEARSCGQSQSSLSSPGQSSGQAMSGLAFTDGRPRPPQTIPAP